MRDVLVTAMVFGSLPYFFKSPWNGVLVWSWLSYMNPHRLAWGFAYTMPFAQIVAITLLVALLASKEDKTLPSNRLITVWAMLLVWLAFCTTQALYPHLAEEQLIKVLKIQLFVFITMLLMKDFQRVNQLIWVIVFSIGFYSVKGGVFTINTGGSYHVFGPDGSDIMENNALAVAILMVIPLMVYLNRFPPKPWVKKIMPYCIFFSMASVIGSQSRGAVLAIIAVATYYWWKSSTKVVTGAALILLAVVALMFMPQTWHHRMSTISDFQNDSSSMGRIRAWEYSIAVANDRITGGGFRSWGLEHFARYNIWVEKAFVAHSIYFSMLNDGGWIGLILFLLILFLMWRQLGRVIALTRNDPERADYNFLAQMLQVSIVSFMAGGAFLSLTYFDLAWHLMAMVITLTYLTADWVRREGVNSRAQWSTRRAPVHGPRGRQSPKSLHR